MNVPAQSFLNEERRIGFELEFLGVDLEKIANLIQSCYGGKVHRVHKNHIEIDTPEWGAFNVKVDVSLMQKLAEASKANRKQERGDVEGLAEQVLAPILTSYMPNEIVTPPVPMSEIGKLEELVVRLRKNKAEGTNAAWFYAFGLHINPEVPSLETSSILAYMQSFILLYDWLAEEVNINVTRKLTPYVNGFGQVYAKLILQPDYTPGQNSFIDDYLEHNPSRNRALDLLPLLAYIDEARVQAVVQSDLVKKRPTYHYRMPNCLVDDPEWSLDLEWQRWCVVESLAWDNARRERMAAEYLECQGVGEIVAPTWPKRLQKYLPDHV